MSTEYEKFETLADSSGAVNGSVLLGQSFTPSIEHTITSVFIMAYRIGTPGTITCQIYAVDVNGFPTGDILASGTASANAWTTDTAGDWYEFTLGAGALLSASTKYIIVLSGGVDAVNQVKWLSVAAGGYTGGNMNYKIGAGDWTANSEDLNFQEWGTPTTPPVDYVMGITADQFLISGIDIILTRTGVQWINQNKSADITASNSTKNSINPTNSSKNNISPTNQTKS